MLISMGFLAYMVMGQSLGELVAAGFSLRRKTQAKACDYHKFPPFTDRLPYMEVMPSFKAYLIRSACL